VRIGVVPEPSRILRPPNPDGHLSVIVGTRADEAAAVRLMDDLGVPIEVEFTPGDTLEDLAPSVGATAGPP
jgi:hypothetical protein